MSATSYSIVMHSQQLQAMGICWPYKQCIEIIFSKKTDMTVENIQEIFGTYLRQYQAFRDMSLELEKYEHQDYSHMKPLSKVCQITLFTLECCRAINAKYDIISFLPLKNKSSPSFDEEDINCFLT